MAERTDERVPMTRILEELRRLRADAVRREDELWDAVDQMRRLVAASFESSDLAGFEADGAPNGDGRPEGASYRRLKRRLRRFVAHALPSGAEVAVMSRGDEDLLELPGCSARHFPRDLDGGYLGFYPEDGTPVIAHLEWVRADGAGYLLLPEPARWWLEKFPLFSDHLDAGYSRIADEDGVGILYDLGSRTRDADSWRYQLGELLEAWEQETGSSPSVLDWDTGLELSSRLPGRNIFTPDRPEPPLPYLDGTVDVVAIRGESPLMKAEARRVARHSVVRFPPDSEKSNVEGNGTRPTASPPVMEHRRRPPPPLPSASIVIPTFNGIGHLRPCLRALDSTLPPRFEGEIVVVDDASGPETALALQRIESVYPWLTVVRNETNQGFITSCNRGAREAGGEFLVFLNDDTVPLSGWLGALLRTFRTHPDSGAVGGRLIYPDGRLQEAGNLIFEDGTGANFGRNDYHLNAPLYAHVRPVHYCSGALLATPRRLFLDLGGFDVRYRPAYYEDTDYCFAVRRRGLKVRYQPECNVVHVEGASSGTDLSSGIKRYQVRNRRIFRKKWRDELRELEPAPASYSAHTWHRLAYHGDDR